jgi:hypothetical protein
MIVSLLYLMARRPDIMFNVYLGATFYTNPKVSHFRVIK